MIVSSSAIRIRIGGWYTLAERLVAGRGRRSRMRAAVWEARSKAPAVALAWPPAPQTSGPFYAPAMLEIHEDAVEPLKGMGALRITAEESDDGGELQLDDATDPQEGDQVV